MSDPQLHESIHFLRSRILVVPRQRIESLQTLSSGAESKVYLRKTDPTQAEVYKLIETRNGMLAGGFQPGFIGGSKEDDFFMQEASQRAPTVLELFHRAELGNEHGGMVHTEVAGVTPDGAIVLKQPYVVGAQPITQNVERFDALRRLHLVPLTRINRNAAVGRAGQTPILVDDLAPRNLMKDKDGAPRIVDAAIRSLHPLEVRIVCAAANIPEDAL